ncbi:MAG: VWA domain-containing protein [Candidatus Lokiarchaeota archaeon]|nr:VWA domain-containing protein [Candidatus Lokiarchaeota archaeon]
MSNRYSENIIICIDTSRSMFRSDYPPSRLICCVKTLKKLVKERLHIDPSSSFAIIRFSNNAEKLLDFSNIQEDIFKNLDSLSIKGTSAIGEALALSIKLIIEELRKIAAKIHKILLISDGNYTKTAIDPLKMARLAQGLNIKIDTFRLSNGGKLNILKRLSDVSGGKYYYNNDEITLNDSAISFANSNLKSNSDINSSIQNPAYLRRIAANLLRVQDLTKDQEQRMRQIRGIADFKKCSICFLEKDPVTNGSFYLTGRYCPNCQTPYHIHCLSNWADSSGDSKLRKSGTCRCPHCFYLLKIPTEVSQAQRLKILAEMQSSPNTGPKSIEIVSALKMKASFLGDEALYNSCPVCNMIFEENQEIIKCGNYKCGVLYHFDCFSKLHNNICKNCGSQLDVKL